MMGSRQAFALPPSPTLENMDYMRSTFNRAPLYEGLRYRERAAHVWEYAGHACDHR